jgi:hypothetical protein
MSYAAVWNVWHHPRVPPLAPRWREGPACLAFCALVINPASVQQWGPPLFILLQARRTPPCSARTTV